MLLIFCVGNIEIRESGKTLLGVNNARLCTQWYVTDEIKKILDDNGVPGLSTNSGTGGTLSNGQRVSEAAEMMTPFMSSIFSSVYTFSMAKIRKKSRTPSTFSLQNRHHPFRSLVFVRIRTLLCAIARQYTLRRGSVFGGRLGVVGGCHAKLLLEAACEI